MTSRTYRGIRIAFFLLLLVACLLVSQAAPLSSARRTKRSSDEGDSEEYNELKKALGNEKYRTTYLKRLQASAKCPFKVLNVAGFTRIVCDFTECTHGNNSCDQDCKQAYVKAADIIPKRSRRKKQVTPADVELGCIYIPKRREHSIETTGPGTATRVV